MEHKRHMNNHVSDRGSGEPLVFRGIDNFLLTYLFKNFYISLFFYFHTKYSCIPIITEVLETES